MRPSSLSFFRNTLNVLDPVVTFTWKQNVASVDSERSVHYKHWSLCVNDTYWYLTWFIGHKPQMNRCQYLFLNNVRENADLKISSIHSAELMETLLTELLQATWSHMPGFSTTSVETICALKPQPNHSRNSWPNPQKNFQGHQWAVAATFHSGVKRWDHQLGLG